MKSHVSFALLLLLTLLGTAIGRGQQDKPLDGPWWETIPENYKQGFIAGYSMGTLREHSLVLENCEGKLGDSPNSLTGYAALETCLTITFSKTFDFSGVRPDQLANAIDEFYKDSRNKSIDINFALLYVRDKLKGKSAKELDDELILWRRAASH